MPKSGLLSSIAAASWFVCAASATAEPSITGMYALDQPAGFKQEQAKVTPAVAAEQAEVNRISTANNRLIGEAHTKCWPTGMPGLMQPPFGIEFLQTKGRITILSEVSNLPRTIYLDEAKHPEPDAILPGWNGHSIGHWEGNVLVVDTIGFNNRQPRVTPKTHITERIFLEKDGHLVDELTVTDPDVYLEPAHIRYRYKPVLGEGSEVMEYVCEVDPANLFAFEKEQRDAGRPSAFDPSWSAASFAAPAPKQPIPPAPPPR